MTKVLMALGATIGISCGVLPLTSALTVAGAVHIADGPTGVLRLGQTHATAKEASLGDEAEIPKPACEGMPCAINLACPAPSRKPKKDGACCATCYSPKHVSDIVG